MILTVHQGQMFKHCSLYELSKIGQLGCQCFFVISGFTLCQSWESRKQTVGNFYKRRLRAIAPGYYFDIILFTIISSIIAYLNIPRYWHQGESLFPGLSHLENILFLHGLSPQSINSIVPGGWYIGTTMLMYLSFPLMKKMLDVVKPYKSGIIILPTVFTIIAIGFWYAVMSFSEKTLIGNNSFAYFFVLTQYPCFLWGGVLYSYSSTYGSPRTVQSISTCIFLACVSLCATVLLFYSDNDMLFVLVPVSAAIFFGCIMLLMIRLIDDKGYRLPRIVLTVCKKISGVSYEMYLIHTLFAYFIVYYLRKILKHFDYSYIFDNSFVFIIFLFGLIVFSYYCGKILKHYLNKLTR